MTALPYQLLDHTADIRVRITAATLKELFIKAADALFDIAAQPRTPRIKAQTRVTVSLEAAETDELFVAWLNELISLAAVRGLVFTRFHLNRFSPQGLKALVYGAPVASFEVKTEIKAATFHSLNVSKQKSGWIAEVIFDT